VAIITAVAVLRAKGRKPVADNKGAGRLGIVAQLASERRAVRSSRRKARSTCREIFLGCNKKVSTLLEKNQLLY